MRFSHFFIDRPIFAGVISILIVLVGIFAYPSLPVAQYPEIAPPTIAVTASYPGASAEVLGDTVAAPLEQQINGVENMLYITSSSTGDGQVTINVVFKLGTNLDTAQVLVQNRVQSALPRLPQEVQQLGVTTVKNTPDILMAVALLSPDHSHDVQYLSNYATIQVRDRLLRLQGIGGINVFGVRDYAMRIWIDPEKAAARNLNASEIVAALRAQNVQVAGGSVGAPPFAKGGSGFELSVQTQGRLTTPQQFGDIVIKADANGALTRVSDVARIEVGAQAYTTSAYVNGEQGVLPRHHPAAGIERARDRGGDHQDDGRGEEGLPARRRLLDPVQPDDLCPAVDRQRPADAYRGGRARRPRRPDLPAKLARGDHSGPRDPGVADRHLRGDGGVRLFAEQPVAVRAGAGDRHRRRRRDRRRRECRTRTAQRPVAARCRLRDDGRSRRRADRHRPDAVRGVRADGVHQRHFGPVLQAVRADHFVGDAALARSSR